MFNPTLERAGIRLMCFNSLRHTFATILIAIGENMKFIQKQMGHASITTTINIYGHLLPDASKGVGCRFDQLVFSDDILPFPKKGNESEGIE